MAVVGGKWKVPARRRNEAKARDVTRLRLIEIISGAVLLCSAQLAGAAAPSACSSDPEYPAPHEPGQLFYLQRTGNANTVVYTVKKDADGNIDAQKPVEVYWRRYAGDGEKRELNTLERLLAFGVHDEPVEGSRDKFFASLVSYPKRKAIVEEDAGGRPRAVMTIAGEDAQLVCIYVEWRPLAGIIPEVLHVDVVGRSLDSKRRIVERIFP
jgi:hypothetical protein